MNYQARERVIGGPPGRILGNVVISDGVLGAIVGGAIGIIGTLSAVLLTEGFTRRQRSRDRQIIQIENTVKVLDAWADLANALVGAYSHREAVGELTDDYRARINAAEAKLLASDAIWDWSAKSIPGDSARELFALCLDVHMSPGMLGTLRPSMGDAGAVLERLGSLQRKMRTAAADRIRELS